MKADKILWMWILAIILFSSMASAKLSIENNGKAWQVIKHDGEEINYDVVIEDNDKQDTKICFIDKYTLLKEKNLYDEKGNPIKLDFELNGDNWALCKQLGKEEYIKFGEQSIIIVYQNISKVAYEYEDLNVNATLTRWDGSDFNTAPDDIWIKTSDESNNTIFKFGANDTASNTTTLYQYEWISNQPIMYDGYYYFNEEPAEGTFFTHRVKRNYLDLSDICTSQANCTYNLTDNNTKLSVEFYGFYNATLGMVVIDPEYDFVFDSSSDIVFPNATEGSNLGARLSASRLFMDFNDAPEGTYVKDNSLYNNYGTNNGATYQASGGYDGSGAYEFDGTGNSIYVGESNDLQTQRFTFSIWANLTDKSSAGGILVSNDNYGTGGSGGWIFMYEQSTDKWAFYIDKNCASSWSVGKSSSTPSLNTWTHLVGTYDTNTDEMKFYVNGVLENVSTASQVCYTGDAGTRIGQYSTAFFNGSIDQVQILDRALSATEIQQLYNGTKNNSEYIGKYANEGDFKSLVYYNTTSTNWNMTFSIADTYSPRNGITDRYGINLSNPNLIAYWTFDETFDDATGRNNGTPTGTENASGLSSKAITIPVNSNYVDVGNDPALDITTSPISISLWINTVSTINANSHIIDKGISPSNEYGYGVQYNGNLDRIIWGDNAGFVYNDGENINDGQWHHIVATYNGSGDETGYEIYLDGNSLVLSEAGTANGFQSSGRDLLIGSEISAGGAYGVNSLHGDYDEFLIYNITLTSSEIESIYKAGLSQHADTNITLETRTASSYNLTDPSLVSFWAMNNDSTLGENDTFIADLMERNDGTINGAVSWAEAFGVVGGAYEFNGVNSYIDLGTNEDIRNNLNNSMSISAWVKWYDGSVTPQIIIGSTNNIGRSGYYLAVHNNKIYMRLANAGGAYAVGQSINNMDTDGLTHIVGTYNGSHIQIYKNGEIDTDVGSITIGNGDMASSNSVTIGARNSGTDNFFNGTIDEVKIYNRSLSASEILSLFELENAHISDWSAWTDKGVITDGESVQSNSGKFLQFKPIFHSNSTSGSPYLSSYVVGTIAGNSPPIIDSVVVTPNPAQSNQDLNGTVIATDANEDNITLWYSWYKNDTLNATSLISNSLLAYYPLNNDTLDYQGSNDGINSGSTQTQGIVGNARDFNGVDNFINLSQAWGNISTSPFSMSAWVKLNKDGVERVILSKGKKTISGDCILYKDTSDQLGIHCEAGTSPNDLSAGSSDWTSDTWTHLVVTENIAAGKIYLNGELKTQDDSFNIDPKNEHDWIIGAAEDGTQNFFNGTIDEVMYFNRTLSDIEVQQLYHGSAYGGNVMNSSQTSAGDGWILGVRGGDYIEFGTELNSSNVEIIDIPPSPPTPLSDYIQLWRNADGINVSGVDVNGSWFMLGDVNASGNVYDNNNRVCTAENGFCGVNDTDTQLNLNFPLYNISGEGYLNMSYMNATALEVVNSTGLLLNWSDVINVSGLEREVDGGFANSVYLAIQSIDGGGA